MTPPTPTRPSSMQREATLEQRTRRSTSSSCGRSGVGKDQEEVEREKLEEVEEREGMKEKKTPFCFHDASVLRLVGGMMKGKGGKELWAG